MFLFFCRLAGGLFFVFRFCLRLTAICVSPIEGADATGASVT